MIKEWIRNFCGYYLLEGICDDIRRDISNLYGEVYTTNNGRRVAKLPQVEHVCKKADLNNEDAIKFILRHLDIGEDIFQGYKYFEFGKTPWYIRELLLSKYNIRVTLEIDTNYVCLYYKGRLIGSKEYSHIGELLDNIKKVDDELSDK